MKIRSMIFPAAVLAAISGAAISQTPVTPAAPTPVTPAAQTPSPPATGVNPGARIDERQSNQQRRIEDGLKSGQLTPQEAERLKQEQARIQKMEEKARADGKISADEARRIKQAQDRASKHIHHERHDRDHGKGFAKGHAGKGRKQ